MANDNQGKFFPGKLRIMLDQVDDLGLSHGSSWVSAGCAFAIHDPEVFMNDISPMFFEKQTHLRSFHRQLNIWGFVRLESGAEGRGVWFHKYFNRDKPELMKQINRIPVKIHKTDISATKNQLPDYANYRLPLSFDQYATNSAKTSGTAATEHSLVHQPSHQDIDTAAVKDATLSQKSYSTGENKVSIPSTQANISSLSALGRRNHVPSRHLAIHNETTFNSGQTCGFPSSLLTSYQPSVNTSIHSLPVLSAVNPSLPSANSLGEVALHRNATQYISSQACGIPSFLLNSYQPSTATLSTNPRSVLSAARPTVPSANNLGEVTHQLLANMNAVPSQTSIRDGSTDLNAAILALATRSDLRGPSAFNGLPGLPQGSLASNGSPGLPNQSLIAAIARQNPFQQGPKP